MNDHRIIGLKDPIELGDAVNRRYVSSRIRALNEEREALKEEVEKNEGRIISLEKILSHNRIMILRWELRNHNPIFGMEDYDFSNYDSFKIHYVDRKSKILGSLDDYLQKFELDSNPHINEFIRYTVHEEKITIIFKAAGDYSVDFRIYGRLEINAFEFKDSEFYVERFRRSGHAIEKIETFVANNKQSREYSLDNVGRDDFIMIIRTIGPLQTLIGSSLTLYYNYNIS